MPSQGPNFVGAGADQGTNWTSTGNVTAEDGATATLGGLPTNNGEVLRCTMGANAFSIPVNDNPSSVTIEIKASYSDAFGGTVSFSKVQLNVGGVAVGANVGTGAVSSGTLAWASFTVDVRGLLSRTDANSSNLGVDIAFSDSGSGPGQVDVDAVRLTMFYDLVDAVVPTGQPMDSGVMLRRVPHFMPPPIESIDPKALTLANAPEPLHPEVMVPMYAPPPPRPQERAYLLPLMGDYDPTSFTLPNAPEPLHPENYPMMFYGRNPQPQRTPWQVPLMGEYDPTMFLFGNEPEPLHPENYPPMALLPYPRPQRAAWDFPIMASTDYTGLLSGESAHPETTRQACADLPRRNWPRQYQPPMEAIDPGALSAREEPSAGDLPPMSQPIHRRPRGQPPTIEATSYVWTTPGDQSQIRIDPMGGPLPQQRHCTFAGETVLLDAWSSQQVEQLLAEPMIQPRRVQPPRLESVAITPQYFQETQIIAWLPPLSLPVHATPRLADQRNQGELTGETVPLAIDPTTTGQFLLPSMGRPRAPGAVRPRPDEPGAETMQQPAVPTYQLVDYDPRSQQPLPPRWRVQPSDIEELTIDTSRFAQPLAEFPPLAQPVRPIAQPARQNDLAAPYSDATNAAADSVGFMGMTQERPLSARARQAHSAQPVTPTDLQKSFFVEPMYAPQRHLATPQQKSTEILVDQQYFPVPSPDGYQAQWFVPIPPRRMQPVPIETASTTVFLVGGNPATFAGSGAFVVVAGAVYSLAPTAGKVVRGSKGL